LASPADDDDAAWIEEGCSWAGRRADACIGKPALRWLPPSSTTAVGVGAAIVVWDGEEGPDLASPAAALVADLSAAAAPLADLLTATASELTGAAVVLWNGEEGSDLASPAAAL